MKNIILAVIFLLGFAGCTTTQHQRPPKMILNYTAGDKVVRKTVGYASAAWSGIEMDTFAACPKIEKPGDLKESHSPPLQVVV